MSMTGLEVFDTTLQKTHIWLNDLTDELHWGDRFQAYKALRAGLHALRDRLTVEEAAHLGAQLPMLIRGLYYEGWTPAGKPNKTRNKDEFLAPIHEQFRNDPEIDPERVARAGLQGARQTHHRRGNPGRAEHVPQRSSRFMA